MSRKKRLIDVDELLKTIPPEEIVSRIAVANAPIVDAVPVEWIKNWMAKSENTYNREQICEMLEEWEKENESNT